MSVKEQIIHDGIVLYTEKLSTKLTQMSVLNQTLSALTFTIDLSGSTGVLIQESDSLTNTVEIQPRAKSVIATIKLSLKYKLCTKFRFSQKPADQSLARESIQSYEQKLSQKLRSAKNILRHVDFNTFNPASIQSLKNFIDPYFPPTDSSINLGTDRQINTVIQWRRPKNFFGMNFKVFDIIEPNDIKQGKLGDCWFMCALASLAERPELVQRLFISREVSPQGFYQVKFCKSGEWVRVTVDDYFPCFPNESPIFSRSHGSELWVLLLEKAYAKLHGSYSLLRGGWAAEGMMDLTGFPTMNIDLSADEGRAFIENDSLWQVIQKYDEIGALISASTPGEDRFSESVLPKTKGGLVPGHAYTVIIAKEALGQRLLKIRNPWGQFEWDGDWSDKSELWTEEMKQTFQPVLDENDGTFWMSYSDFIKNFATVNICRVECFEEARIKSTFERTAMDGITWVVSKAYFLINCVKDAKVTVGLHQEDPRNYGVEQKRSPLDIGLAVLEMNDSGFEFYSSKEAVTERQVELDLEVHSGKMYLIWPRTSGCYLARPEGAEAEDFKWFEEDELHPLFESTIKDLFKKANKVLGEDLTYNEFSELLRKAGLAIRPQEFADLVRRLPSHENGLTQEGLIEFIREKCLEVGEETIKEWFSRWGYDQDLYSVESRNYIVTFHSREKLKIQMKNPAGMGLNDKINEMLLEKYGELKGVIDGVKLFCYMERAANAFLYGVFNDNEFSVRAALDCSSSEGLCFSGGEKRVEVEVGEKKWKVIMHCQISKNAQGCKIRPSLSVRRD